MIGYILSCKGDNLNKNVIIYVQIVDRNTRYKEVNAVQLIKIILKYLYQFVRELTRLYATCWIISANESLTIHLNVNTAGS